MARPPQLESAIMDILWDADRPLTPSEVRAHLAESRQLAYSTVKTVLDRLSRKGRVIRSKQSRAYSYRPVRSRVEHAAFAMEEVLEMGRDRASTLAHFLRTLSASDRRKLRDMLGDD